MDFHIILLKIYPILRMLNDLIILVTMQIDQSNKDEIHIFFNLVGYQITAINRV